MEYGALVKISKESAREQGENADEMWLWKKGSMSIVGVELK